MAVEVTRASWIQLALEEHRNEIGGGEFACMQTQPSQSPDLMPLQQEHEQIRMGVCCPRASTIGELSWTVPVHTARTQESRDCRKCIRSHASVQRRKICRGGMAACPRERPRGSSLRYGDAWTQRTMELMPLRLQAPWRTIQWAQNRQPCGAAHGSGSDRGDVNNRNKLLRPARRLHKAQTSREGRHSKWGATGGEEARIMQLGLGLPSFPHTAVMNGSPKLDLISSILLISTVKAWA